MSIRMRDVVDHGRLIRKFMPALQAAVAPVTNEHLQRAADTFRRSTGLTSAEATEAWMSRHGITMEFFQEFLESVILFRMVADQPEENAV